MDKDVIDVFLTLLNSGGRLSKMQNEDYREGFQAGCNFAKEIIESNMRKIMEEANDTEV